MVFSMNSICDVQNKCKRNRKCSCFPIPFNRQPVCKLICNTRLSFRKKTWSSLSIYNEPVHEISNNVVCATSKASDQPAHMHSLIRAFASRLSIL